MRQIIRFYLRYDLDLLSLKAQGVSLQQLAKIAIKSYAYGERVKIVPPSSKEIEIDSIKSILKQEKRKDNNQTIKKAMSCRCEITIKDPEEVKLLHQIRTSYRAQFIKTLMRNILEEQPLIPYFDQIDAINKENRLLTELETDTAPSVKRLPAPMVKRQVNVKDYLVAPRNYKEESPEKKNVTTPPVQEEKVVSEHNLEEQTQKTATDTEINTKTINTVPETKEAEMDDTIISPISDLSMPDDEAISETSEVSDENIEQDEIAAAFGSLIQDL